jgi:hypothetical protein
MLMLLLKGHDQDLFDVAIYFNRVATSSESSASHCCRCDSILLLLGLLLV